MFADLAEQVARDGEGARKLIEIVVEGAKSKKSARRIALSIANSPLVKTAVGGEDANWGPSSWRWAKQANRPIATALDLVQRHSRRHKGSLIRTTTRPKSAAMKKPEIALK